MLAGRLPQQLLSEGGNLFADGSLRFEDLSLLLVALLNERHQGALDLRRLLLKAVEPLSNAQLLLLARPRHDCDLPALPALETQTVSDPGA